MSSPALGQVLPVDTTKHDTLNVDIIPIVFIPGVMGSRLTIPGGNNWDPDDPPGMLKYASASTADKRRDLNPATSPSVTVMTRFSAAASAEVAQNDALTSIANASQSTADVFYASTRGWAGVAWGFYGGILQYLETQFNLGSLFLTSVKNPVYAFGYDWRLNNELNGRKLSAYVDTVLARHPGSKQVAILTHSMGGLVARAGFAFVPALVGKVMGVVHTVQPSNGAVTAYRRFFTGCISGYDGSGLSDRVIQVIMGKSAEDYAAIMSGLPGPMQLLPNHRYSLSASKPWLITNPQVDVTKIYDVYQGSFQPGIVSPALNAAFGPLDGAIIQAAIVARIEEGRAFHTTLGDTAHPNTYVMYSTGLKSDESAEFLDSGRMTFVQQLAGDGTVHQQSGSCPGLNPADVKQRVPAQGLEHSAVYQSPAFNLQVVGFLRQILSGP